MAAARTLGIIGTGDMGSAVGGAYVRAGYRVVTALAERSAASRALAARAGLTDLGSLRAVAGAADLILSIVPPANAHACAESAAVAMVEAGTQPVFVDCNAVAPATACSIARIFAALGAAFVDAGIVGRGPVPGVEPPTRFFVSGAERARVLELQVPGIRMIDMGEEIGTASAIKMAYAALNKGTDALYATVLLAAERLGVRAQLMPELALSQREALARMEARVPYLAATAARFAGEMDQIALTYEAAGVTPLFHRGAEWLYATLATTPLASETRATLPAQRSLDDAVTVFAAAVHARQPQ
jgi:3-hydroxyisobutyrate dehydrogenase-like beta-hydroxyacid dehydrogenase